MNDKAPHQDWFATSPETWINNIKATLLHINPFVHSLITLLSITSIDNHTPQLIISDTHVDEIAAIISYENTTSHVSPINYTQT
jgi:hypothetical protein